MKNFIIIEKFQSGLGNKLFMYFYGYILSKEKNLDFFHPKICELNIEDNRHLAPKNIKGQIIIFDKLFENYLLYKTNLKSIKATYTNTLPINNEDLVIHLRAGNDWVSQNVYAIPSVESYKKLLEKIKFKKLYIVTNCQKYEKWTTKDLYDLREKLKSEGGDGDNIVKYKSNNYAWDTDEQKSLDKINNILELFNSYRPVWVFKTAKEDFDFMCSFEKIILSASTFSWWAGVLGAGKEIYVYKPWKNKLYLKIGRKDKCKNLGETDYEGWMQYE